MDRSEPEGPQQADIVTGRGRRGRLDRRCDTDSVLVVVVVVVVYIAVVPTVADKLE